MDAMTSEDAAALLEAFRAERNEAPKVDPYVLANAYLRVLGSLSPETDKTYH